MLPANIQVPPMLSPLYGFSLSLSLIRALSHTYRFRQCWQQCAPMPTSTTSSGTQFSCFTSTKVPILTPQELLLRIATLGPQWVDDLPVPGPPP